MPMLQEDALAINSGRNCLRYIVKARGIKKLLLPKFDCVALEPVCRQCGVSVRKFSVGMDFKPIIDDMDDDEWLYVINYYNQLSGDYLSELLNKYNRVIFDNTHAYYEGPVGDADTIYTCRKYFGVPDGAFLYTKCMEQYEKLETGYSCDGMTHLLGRYERTASEYYSTYVESEENISRYPLQRMSRLTANLLRGIDYDKQRVVRESNYRSLHELLGHINILSPVIPTGPYMYPLMLENAGRIRSELIKKQIYIPVLWPNVLDECEEGSIDYKLAADMLPLPVDQRYSIDDMLYIADTIKELL